MGDQSVGELDRVLTRLALTEDNELEQVLSRLLPIVIGRLNGAPPLVQKKVIEILSHANKRLQAHPVLQLPLHELVALYRDPASGPMARNFALVYIENAAARAPAERRFAELDALLSGLSGRPTTHQEMLLRVAAQALEAMTQQANAFEFGKEEEFASRYSFLSSPADRQLLLAFGLKLLLYQPPSVRVPTSALQAAQHAQQPQAMEVDGALPAPPAGMSRAAAAAVEGKQAPAADTLLRRKLGLLNYSAAASIPPAEVLVLYLAASCDPSEQVSKRGEELLRKRCGVDSPKPAVDLEDSSLMEALYELYHGSLEDEALPEQERRTPASVALRSRLLGLFSKSIAAANCFPFTLTTITDCLYGQGTTPRLRQQGMELAVWVFKHSMPQQLAPAAAAILEGCLTLLDQEPTQGQDTVSLTLRGFTYQAIGQLAQRQPLAFSGRTDIVSRFFSALATEPAGVRATVQEAISALGGAFKGCQGEVLASVRALLLESVGRPQEAVRMAALLCAVKLFPFNDVPARYICMLAAADTRFSIADAGLDGLKPDKFAAEAGAAAGLGPNGAQLRVAAVQYPTFEEMLQYLVKRHPQLGQAVVDSAALPLPSKAFLAAISFLERCRVAGSTARKFPAGPYLTLLENVLVREAPSELHGAALGAMLGVAGRHPAAYTSAFADRTGLLLRLLAHVEQGTRGTAAKLLGMLVPALGAAQVERLVGGLLGMLGSEVEGKKARFEEADGAITALGFIAAQLLMAPPAGVPPSLTPQVLTRLRQALDSPDRQLAASAALALGHASLALGEGPGGLEALPDAEALVPLVAGLLQDKDIKVVRRGAQALGYLCCGHASLPGVLSPACEALLGLRTSKSEEALFASGEALCFAFGSVPVAPRDVLATSFHSLADWMRQRQEEEEAGGLEHRGQEERQPGGEQGLVAPMEMDAGAGPQLAGGSGAVVAVEVVESSGVGEGDPAALVEAQDKILGSIMNEYILNSRAEVRCAGAVWLVSLVLYTGRHPRVTKLLPDIQETLSQLLGDSNELTQEMASRGLASVYNLADDATRQALVNALVGTLSGAPQKRRAVKLSADTQVFETGQLGTAPGGGGLSTYKELCALATDLGQPDLVYRFMELANHQAALNSSRGAAFGFASIAKIAGQQLGPHVATIIPRLYRYLYDPNGKVRDAMSHIWHALLDDPKRSVSQHFGAIMASLLIDLASNQWRVRESAANAMGDLLQGRRWEELRPHFEELWTLTFRVMDDIKETVRQAGLSLGKNVRGLTLRLADPELTPPSQGRGAISLALPLLLEKGLPSQVPEVQALSLATSAKLVKAAGAELLRPHMPLLVPAMLESLSGLEDSRLNYIEQHAGRLGLDAAALESARVSAAQGGPVGETLDICARYMDAPTLVELAPRLAALVRRGVGLNTRAGAGRFISHVSRRLGREVQPAAPQLIKALVEACKADRSGAVKRSFAAACASVAKFAVPARVDRLVADCLAMYGAEDADQNSRLVAGLLLRELGKEAGDVFAQHASSVAPVAFMAQCDDAADVASMWGEVWDESTTSAGGGLRLHIKDIAQLITAGLQSAQWGRKKAGAAALKRACTAAPDALQPLAPALVEVLLKELPGRLWEGKEVVVEALGALAVACPQQLLPPQQQQQQGPPAAAAAASTAGDSSSRSSGSGGQAEGATGLAGRVVGALVEAGAKKKSAYRRAALEQLEAVLQSLQKAGGGDYLEAVAPLLLQLCSKFQEVQAGPRKMDTDGGLGKGSAGGGDAFSEDKAAESVPVAQAVACLAAAWCTAGPATAQRHMEQVLPSLTGVLAAAAKLPDQLAAVTAATRFAEHCSELAAGAAPTGGSRPPPLLLAADLTVAQRLLADTLRLAGEGNASQLREQCLRLTAALLVGSPDGGGGPLWAVLGEEGRQQAVEELRGVADRERLPALQAQAGAILARLGGPAGA